MSPLLYNAPTDVPMWLSFGAVHQTDHFQITAQIWQKKQLLVPMLPIDPVPLGNPWAMLAWFQDHQALHNLMNEAVGLGTTDLSYADFSDRERITVWMQYNAYEHQRIAAVLAGLSPSLPPTIPASVLQRPGTPILPGDPNVT